MRPSSERGLRPGRIGDEPPCESPHEQEAADAVEPGGRPSSSPGARRRAEWDPDQPVPAALSPIPGPADLRFGEVVAVQTPTSVPLHAFV